MVSAMTPRYERLCSAYVAFATVPAPLAARIEADARTFHLPRGHDLDVREAQRVPFVLHGTLHVGVALPSGRQAPLYGLQRGDWCVLSLAQLFGGGGPPVVAHGVDDTDGLTLGHTLLETLLGAVPALASTALRGAAARVVQMAHVVADLAVTTVDQRLAALLLERGPQIDATHQGLAEELGTAREVVSRALEHFATDGLVRLRRAHRDRECPRPRASRHLSRRWRRRPARVRRASDRLRSARAVPPHRGRCPW